VAKHSAVKTAMSTGFRIGLVSERWLDENEFKLMRAKLPGILYRISLGDSRYLEGS